MRRMVLAVLAGVAVWGLSACERAERPGVFEPAFGKMTVAPNPCPNVIGEAASTDDKTSKYEIVVGLYGGIDDLFQDIRSRNGAKSHVDNIVREVCEGDYVSAQNFLQILIQQIKNQPDDFLLPYQPHGDELEAWAQVLATDLKGLTLPEGALAFDGGLAIASGEIGAPPAKTRNGHVVVNASDFAAGGPFIIALSPVGNHDFPSFGTTGDTYEIVTDGTLETTANGDTVPVLVVFCGSYSIDLRIVHQKKDFSIELLDPEYDLGGICGGTTTGVTSALLKHSPGWFRSFARLTGGAIRKVFGPTAVYARRRETGLGGRTKSFSPFAPVDPYAALSLDLAVDKTSVAIGENAQFTATLSGPADVLDLVASPTPTWNSDPVMPKWLNWASESSCARSAIAGVDAYRCGRSVTGWAESGTAGAKVSVRIGTRKDSTYLPVKALPTDTIGYVSRSIGEFGEKNTYAFNWTNSSRYPREPFTGDGKGTCAAPRMSFSTVPAAVESPLTTLCLAGAATLPTGFSIETIPGAAPPAGVYAKLHDSFALTSGKDYTSPTVTIPADCHALTITKLGDGTGSVSQNVSGATSTTCATAAKLDDWQDVVLTATPDASSEFTGWTGTCNSVELAATGRCAFRMGKDRTVTATFIRLARINVYIRSRVPGSIEVTWPNQDGSCTARQSQDFKLPAGCVDYFRTTVSLTLTARSVDYTGTHDIWFSTPTSTLVLDPVKCQPKWHSTSPTAATCQFDVPAGGADIYVDLTR